MHERGKSDSAVVARNSVKKAEQSAAETMERRAGAKGVVISKARAGTEPESHKRWNAYDEQQGIGRRSGSPRSPIMSVSISFGSRSWS